MSLQDLQQDKAGNVIFHFGCGAIGLDGLAYAAFTVFTSCTGKASGSSGGAKQTLPAVVPAPVAARVPVAACRSSHVWGTSSGFNCRSRCRFGLTASCT